MNNLGSLRNSRIFYFVLKLIAINIAKAYRFIINEYCEFNSVNID